MTSRLPRGGLDQKSPLPLFHQLLSMLRDDILCGTYNSHDKLPSESELCHRYGVSRATVRMALDKLVEQRLVYRHQGKGTFVSAPEPQLMLLTDPSFARELRIRGMQPSIRTLAAEWRSTPADVLLEMPGALPNLFYVERVILANDEPWGIARMYFHPDYELYPDYFESGHVGFEVLAERLRIRIVDARYLYLEPVLVGERDADLLQVKAGTPGLDVARLVIDQYGRAAMHARVLFRADRCRALFSSRDAAVAELSVAPAERRRAGNPVAV
jgi:GntR family transcriptional regulator